MYSNILETKYLPRKQTIENMAEWAARTKYTFTTKSQFSFLSFLCFFPLMLIGQKTPLWSFNIHGSTGWNLFTQKLLRKWRGEKVQTNKHIEGHKACLKMPCVYDESVWYVHAGDKKKRKKEKQARAWASGGEVLYATLKRVQTKSFLSTMQRQEM